tara:strand:- start:1824 stop:2366 length:543 start_codon:yes stop_codon:yes gene_type:complete
MKKPLLLFGFLIGILVTDIHSQTYLYAMGARAGTDAGLTFKHFFKHFNSFEAILHYGRDDFFGLNKNMPGNNYSRLTALVQTHKHTKGLSHAPGLHYYLGVGGHLGFYNNAYVPTEDQSGKEEVNYIAFGLDINFGFEYMFLKEPFTVGIDLKPYYSWLTNPRAPKNNFNAALVFRHTIH